MTLYLYDHTKNKLFLAAEFLSFLNHRPQTVKLMLLKNSPADYGAFFRFFPNIEIQHQEEQTEFFSDRLTIRFIDHLGKIPPADLYFPVVKTGLLAGYQKKRQAEPACFIPLDAEEKAGGYLGGEMLSAEDMLWRKLLNNDFAGKKILISAGPTAEDMDPVRFLSNRSTGKMGLALARAAYMRGAQVRLVIGPGNLKIPAYLHWKSVRSAEEMARQVLAEFPECDVYIGAAAVADFRPTKEMKEKIKKGKKSLKLILRPTPDILQALQAIRQHQLLVGFSVETIDELKNSQKKMASKNLDLIVINNPKDKGAAFATETNRVTILSRSGKSRSYPLMSKLEVSHIILDRLKEFLK